MLTRASAQPMSLALTNLLNRVRGEYQEMPGLSLSKAQMQKMWGFLRRTSGGAYLYHGTGF